MKPRLIKFSCPACGTRLAVPRHLAGVADHCPKCAAVVVSPIPADEGAPPQVRHVEEESPAQSSPPDERTLEKTIPGAGPPARTMRAARAPVEPLPPPEHPPRPVQPDLIAENGTTLLESILKSPPAEPEPELTEDVLPVEPEPEPPVEESIEPPPAEPAEEPMPHTSSSIVEGLTRRIFSEHTMGAASHSPGMGEMLEAHFTTSPVPSAPRHRTPGLGIDLMQVDATSRRDRIHRFAARGVVVFLLVDLCVLLWMGWVRVRKWWTDEPHPVHKAVPVSTGSQIGLKPVAEAAPKTPAVVAPSTVATTKPGPAPVSNIVAETGNKKDTSAPPTLPTLPQASVMNLPLPALPGLDLGNPLTRPPAELMNSTGDLVAPSTIASINPPFPSSSPPETPKTTVSNDTKPVLDSTPPMAAPNAILAPIITDPSKSPSSPPPIPPLPSDPLKPPPEVAMTLAKADHLPMAFGPTEPVDPPPPAQPDVATHPPADLPVSKIIETGVPPEAASALKAVKAFLAATTWKERLQWSQKPETIKAAMEKHYRTFPDGPVNVTHVDFIQRFPSKGDTPPYCMFEVRGPSMTHPVLMLVDQPLKKDARVDWETFIEFKDDLLFKFLKKSSTTPGRFRVMMRRAHVFDKDLPDRENKAGFEVFTPNSDFKGSVYVRKGSDTSRQLDIKLPWNNDVPVIVELIWRGQGEQTWVELQSVVSYGWRA